MRGDAERIARNEDSFRKHNELLRLQQGPVTEMLLLCECGDPGCGEPLDMRPDEYERLRSHASRFAVVPGHEIAEVEDVVDTRGRYVVVQKLGVAGDEAKRRHGG